MREHRVRYPRPVVVVRPRPVVVRPVVVHRHSPPGQAKKAYRAGYREGRHDGHGHGRKRD